MTVQEIKSRLFHIKGEGRLETAYKNDGTSIPVEKGRCLYIVRLELALEGHPEIKEDKFDMRVITTKEELSYSKGLGGVRRGVVGDVVPFDGLIEDSVFPKVRSDKPIDLVVKEALTDLLSGYRYNCRFNVYSEFDGYWDGFRNHFNERRTYLPIVRQAMEEVQTVL